MIRSMTGFDRREMQVSWGSLVWEVRSVNHRYLEMFVRLPDELRGLDGAVREHVAKKMARGKIDCTLRYQAAVGTTEALQVNHAYAQKVVAACNSLADITGDHSVLRNVDLLRWPGVVNAHEPDMTPVMEAALHLLDKALSGLIDMRSREGKRLGDLVAQRCDALRERVNAVRLRRPDVLDAQTRKLRERIADLDVPVDSSRLEQELVILTQRLDVQEELDRLDTHLDEILSTLGRDEPVGRRLDFLMQELNREANTLSSKSVDAETTRHAVDMKVLIEQMREQIQNIE
jgi:uncharacterized protein (TIGR00255 family)